MKIPKWPKATLTAITLTLTSSPALACGTSAQIGEVCYTAADFCPVGFAPAYGQLLPIQQHQALFSILGTNYGGDGRTTFALPDLRGRVAVGTKEKGGVRKGFGVETVEISVKQLPPHTQKYTGKAVIPAASTYVPVSSAIGTLSKPTGSVQLAVSTTGDAIYSSQASTISAIPVTIPKETFHKKLQTTGQMNTSPTTVSQPSIVLTACIAMDGSYPQRP